MARKWRNAKTRKRSRMPCIPRAPPRCDSHAFRCTMGRRPKGERKARKKRSNSSPSCGTRRRIVSAIRLERCFRTDRSTGKRAIRFQSPPGNGNVRPVFFHGSNEQTLATRSTIRSANNIYTCKCDIIHRLEVGGWLLYPGLERVSSIVKFWSSVYFYHFFFFFNNCSSQKFAHSPRLVSQDTRLNIIHPLRCDLLNQATSPRISFEMERGLEIIAFQDGRG